MFDDLSDDARRGQQSIGLVITRRVVRRTRKVAFMAKKLVHRRHDLQSFNAPETTTILNVEPGSWKSAMTGFLNPADEAPGLFGSKFGSAASARISPVRGRTMIPENT